MASPENKRRLPRSRAVSLIEAVFAFVILGFALLPAMSMFLLAGRQTRQTSDYNLVLAAIEKSGEELRLASWENVHLAREIQRVPASGGKESIVGGRSPYFDVLEDGIRPYGRLEPGIDPAITPDTPALFTLLKSFRLGFSTTPQALEDGAQVLDLRLRLEWSDFQGKVRDYETTLTVGQHSPGGEIPPLVEDRDQADSAIVGTLYPEEAGRPLAQIVNQRGGHLAAVRALGDLVLLERALSAGAASFDERIADLKAQEAATVDPLDKLRLLLTRARSLEARSATHFQAMTYLVEPIRLLSAGSAAGQLGTPAPSTSWYEDAARALEGMDDEARLLLARARQAYAESHNPPLGESLPPRSRTRVFMKVLELHKLELLTTEDPDRSVLKKMLSDFLASQAGRNSSFFSFALQELDMFYTEERGLENNYPATDRVRAWKAFQTDAPEAVKTIEDLWSSLAESSTGNLSSSP